MHRCSVITGYTAPESWDEWPWFMQKLMRCKSPACWCHCAGMCRSALFLMLRACLVACFMFNAKSG